MITKPLTVQIARGLVVSKDNHKITGDATMSRVTAQQINLAVTRLNKILGTPETVATKVDGAIVTNIGHILADNAPVYGGWGLRQICNEQGGQQILMHRMPAKHFIEAVQGMERLAEILKEEEN